MKKYFNKTTTAILLLLGAVLIGVFLLWPMLQEFLRVEHELEQYNIALVGREKYVSNLVILARQLDAREEAIRKIEAAIPDNTSIPVLFDLLQNISISSGFIVTKMTSSPKESNLVNLDIVVTKISLEAIGTYDALKTFIAQTRSSARLFEVTSISFDSSGAGVLFDSDQFEFTLELETYED